MQNKALTFIFLTILLDVIGLGIIIPIIPDLIKEITGEGLSDAAKYGGWIASSFSLMLFFFSPILGGLSDQYGRRPILLIALFGLGIDYILQGLAPSLFWLFVGRIIAGIAGSSFTTAAAYISDVSEPDKKAQNFGLIGAAFGLGFVLGPLLGALLGDFGIRVPFFVAAGCAFANFIFGYFVLPESLDVEHRRPFDWKRANPLGTLKVLTKYPSVMNFILVLFLVYTAHYSLQSTWNFFTMEKFQWNHRMVGISLAAVGLLMAIVQGGLTRILIPKLGIKHSIIIGMSCAMVGYFAYAFAPTTWSMFVIMVIFSINGIAGPAIQSMISNQVPPNAQGELQGGLTGLMSLTAIIGPLIMTSIFNYFTKPGNPIYFPGASFFTSFVLMLIGILITVYKLRNYNNPSKALPS